MKISKPRYISVGCWTVDFVVMLGRDPLLREQRRVHRQSGGPRQLEDRSMCRRREPWEQGLEQGLAREQAAWIGNTPEVAERELRQPNHGDRPPGLAWAALSACCVRCRAPQPPTLTSSTGWFLLVSSRGTPARSSTQLGAIIAPTFDDTNTRITASEA